LHPANRGTSVTTITIGSSIEGLSIVNEIVVPLIVDESKHAVV
jgi:hypothetical protein